MGFVKCLQSQLISSYVVAINRLCNIISEPFNKVGNQLGRAREVLSLRKTQEKIVPTKTIFMMFQTRDRSAKSDSTGHQKTYVEISDSIPLKFHGKTWKFHQQQTALQHCC